ncbi:MAG TPA: GNAT family N-acetyltransferase [Eubacteriales bacterium]|nr:GNAT family N-acetyltransferase [Eubacteriales bacterium]
MKKEKAQKEREVPTKRLRIVQMEIPEMDEMIEVERDAHLKAAYTQMRDGAKKDPEQAEWYAAWKISLKETGEMVGDLCFKGPPDDLTAEIGYGVLEAHRHKGYAKEAVDAMTDWAFSQGSAYYVRAITDEGNAASERVLEKSGYKKLEQPPENVALEAGQTLWEKEKPATSWMAILMCLGLSIGVSLGLSAFDNVGMGLSIGLSIGLAMGVALDAQDRAARKRRYGAPECEAPQEEPEKK